MRHNARKDRYCWVCHKDTNEFSCKACPRGYHRKCLPQSFAVDETSDGAVDDKSVLCPVCIDICDAEDGQTRSTVMSWLDGQVDHLAQLLEFAVETIKTADKHNTFLTPVSDRDYPDYRQLIANPMDMSSIEQNVVNHMYASTNSFLADVKWIHHNCVIYNQSTHDYVKEALNLIRVAKQECSEIEICPDCYKNYYCMEDSTYFAEPCRKPHAIVWAKLSGHPFWPAKIVKFDSRKGQVDVRFFGTHDKCWLNPKQCYLMSKSYPNNTKPNKFDETKFNEAIKDMNLHLDRLEMEYPGVFQFWPIKTVFKPEHLYLLNQNAKSAKLHNGVLLKNLKVKPSFFDIRNKFDLISDEQSDSSDNRLVKKIRSVSSTSSVSSNANTSKNMSNLSNDVNICRTNELNEEKPMETDREDSNDVHVCRNNGDIMDSPTVNNTLSLKASECDDSIDSNNIHNNGELVNESNDNLTTTALLERAKSKVKRTSDENYVIKVSNINNNNKIKNNKQKTILSNDCVQCVHKPEVQVSMLEDKNTEMVKRIKKLEEERVKYKRHFEEEKDKHLKQMAEIQAERDKYRQLLNESNKNIEEIKDIKRKQWCTYCFKEAILPCCWNTSYCTVECQHNHWPTHMKTCRRRQRTAQQQTNV